MTKDALREGFLLFSPEEQSALLRLLDLGQQDLVAGVVRAKRRRKQLLEADDNCRLLVGARVHRQTAERYRKCARARGLSLYRFVCNALEREFQRLQE